VFKVVVDKNTIEYKTGRKVGIVIGAMASLFALTVAHLVANGIVYWK